MTKDFGSYSAPKDVHHSPPRFTNPSWGNALTLHTDLMQKAHFYAFLTNRQSTRQSIVPKTEKCVEKDRKGMHWNALGPTPGWFWTQSSRRRQKRTLQRWQTKSIKICCAQGRCGSCVGNGVIHLSYTHRGTHPLFIVAGDPAVSTKASWLERASLLDGAGMIGIASRLISMHFVEQVCSMMNDSDIADTGQYRQTISNYAAHVWNLSYKI